MSNQKILIGLSGGVDSSVSAYLLKQQGYHVEAVFMQNWESDPDDEYCSAADDRADAARVCEKLNIPLHCVNFAKEYWDHVFNYFLSEYRAGRTPNPDVLCNREIKFKAFLNYALEQGADLIATGHYAQIRFNLNEWQLLRGLDPNKDQSYFLYLLTQFPLSKTLFPVGHLRKPEVRKIAAELNFITADKKDSTGICFIGERKFKEFLQQYLPAQPGEIVTDDGTLIGEHDGLMYHTLGQREGLKIGGRADGTGEAWYVAQKDVANNRLIVVQGKDHPLLFQKSLSAEQMHWINDNAPTKPLLCTAKTRYRQPDEACTVTYLENGRWNVDFSQPQRSITPGQSVVFYQDEVCLGGGIIV